MSRAICEVGNIPRPVICTPAVLAGIRNVHRYRLHVSRLLGSTKDLVTPFI